MKKTIIDFAEKTKHRNWQLDPPTIIRKILAVHSPLFVDWHLVYPHISNDYAKLQFRCPDGLENFAEHEELPFEFWKEALCQQNINFSKFPVLSDFVKKNFPNFNDVNDKHDQPLIGFFLHGSMKKHNYVDSLKKLAGKNADELYEKFKEYKLPKNCDPDEVAQEIGTLIKTLKFDGKVNPDELVVTEKFNNNNNNNTIKSTINNNNNKTVDISPQIFPTNEPLVWDAVAERKFRQHPTVINYKQEIQVPNQFPSKKILKQLLILKLRPKMLAEHKSLMGKRQLKLSSTKTEIQPDILDYVDYLPKSSIDSMMSSIEDFIAGNDEYESNQEAIKAYLAAYLFPANKSELKNKKFVKKFVKNNSVSENVLKHIIYN